MPVKKPFQPSQDKKPSELFAELNHSESDISTILDHSLDGIIVLDSNGVVLFINSAVEEIFGRDRESLIGIEFGYPVPKARTTEVNIFRKDMGHRVVEFKSRTFTWKNKQTCILISLRDITDRKWLEKGLVEKEREKSTLMDNMSDMVITIDSNNMVTSVNKVVLDTLQARSEDVVNVNIDRLFLDRDFKKWLAACKKRIEGKSFAKGSSCSISRFTVNLDKGRSFEAEAGISAMKINGQTSYIITVRDVSDNVESERQLRIMSNALKQSLLAKVIVDIEGVIEISNSKFYELSGLGSKEVVGRHVQKVFDSIGILIDFGKIMRGKSFFTTEKIARNDDKSVWVEQYISPIRSHSNKITHFLISQEDVTQRERLKEQLNVKPTRDDITGGLNKAGIEEEIQKLLSYESFDSHQTHLFHIEIDHLSAFLDTCGEKAGQELMKVIAEAIYGAGFEDIKMGRLEPATFVLIYASQSQDEADRIASNILKSVREIRFSWEGSIFNPTVTVIHLPFSSLEEGVTVSSILQTLTTAAHVYGDRGGDQTYSLESVNEEMAHYQKIAEGVSLVHRALDEDLFCLFYQPICKTNGDTDGDAEGNSYEVLLRMYKDGEYLSPYQFLPAVEKYKLGFRVDQWVVGHMLEWLSRNRQHLEDLRHCGLNLTAESLCKEQFIDFVSSKIDEFSIPPEKLCFEITETAAVNNFNIANRHLADLREMGCKVALDDFGTGMSSFNYLKQFQIDYLKIDGSFVRNITSSSVDFAMVNSICSLSKHMNLKTIAEFIENEETLNILRLIGVEYAQGYYLGRPTLLC